MHYFFRVMLSMMFLASSGTLFAQGGLVSSPVGTTRDGGLAIYGREGSNNAGKIPYESIQGTPFWKDEFIMATLIDKSNQVLAKTPVKLNLYANEVYFKNEQGEVRVTAPGIVAKIIFYQHDSTSQVRAVFDNTVSGFVAAGPLSENPAFVQVLNQGAVQLLKHTVVRFVTEAPRLGAMKQYSFSPHSQYYLHTEDGVMHKLKKLNKEVLSENIKVDKNAEDWIQSQRIDLKSEEGVALFLNYYNEQQKSGN